MRMLGALLALCLVASVMGALHDKKRGFQVRCFCGAELLHSLGRSSERSNWKMESMESRLGSFPSRPCTVICALGGPQGHHSLGPCCMPHDALCIRHAHAGCMPQTYNLPEADKEAYLRSHDPRIIVGKQQQHEQLKEHPDVKRFLEWKAMHEVSTVCMACKTSWQLREGLDGPVTSTTFSL